MDTSAFIPGSVSFVSGANIPGMQDTEIRIDETWVHIRETGTTKVRTVPVRLVERIDWDWAERAPEGL